METNMVEAMLENEQHNSADRISSLEKRVQQQADELICMKSALADVIRRMQQVETTQQQQQQQIFSQLSTSSSPHKNLIASIGKPTISHHKPASNRIKDKDNHESKNGQNGTNGSNVNESIVKESKSTSSKNEVKSNGLSNGSSNTDKAVEKAQRASHKSLQASVETNQSISFNSDAGLVKFFIRGRPITLTLPNTNQVSPSSNEIGFKFDLESKIKAPKENLKLEWVYGYRGKDCRSNLYQLPTGEIIYFIAATVVLYNVEERTQRHYLGHTDDVKSLCIHPDKVTVATGQAAGHDKLEGRAHVRIWDSYNLTTLKVIGLSGNDFQNSICCLSFSKTDGGQHLAVVDDGSEKWLSVWNWQNTQKVTGTKCYGDLVFAAEFHPTEKNLIVTCGKQHIFFWQFEGQHLTKRSGSFEIPTSTIITNGSGAPINASSLRIDKPKYVLCISFGANGEVISGDSEGNLIFWNAKENKITRVIKEAHENGIFSIYCVQNQQSPDFNASGTNGSQPSRVTMITGGGKDGKIIEWNQDYQKTGRQLQIPESNGMCRFISSGTGNLFLIGTTKNSIFQASFDLNYLNCIMNSHVEELWGLATHPRASYFLTCGNDKNLIYWDTLSHSSIWLAQLEEQLHCVHIHPQYDLAAIGLTKAKWIVFDLSERKSVFSQIEGTEQIECIQYSPNGQYLACGSRDNYIYIYGVSENGLKYTRIGRCGGHSSFITHIDWSVDSEFLVSNSGDHEILYWQASTCKQVLQLQQIRELKWKTNNCTLSFNTLGVWNSTPVQNESAVTAASPTNGSTTNLKENGSNGVLSMDGTDINACSASNSNTLLAAVDDFGKVNLFSYPCNGAKSEKRVYQGHSSHVTNVSFINNDTRLITVGGNDMAIFQWSVCNE